MSDVSPEFLSYVNHMAFLRNGMSHLPIILKDWAMHTTNLASEWVEQQFLAHIAGRPLVQPPPELDTHDIALLRATRFAHDRCIPKSGRVHPEFSHGRPFKLDINVIQEDDLLAKFPPTKKILLDHPSMVINSGYRIIMWYIPDGLSPWVQKSIVNQTESNWRILGSNFRPTESPRLTPGCINIALCWFQQGHECYGLPPETTPPHGPIGLYLTRLHLPAQPSASYTPWAQPSNYHIVS
ncbi:hypothetical protein BDR03DRAFT_987710 [Suillus americanus]|nr:hypothetical protein BDR03DRAFT_987710 [Suillus americanus]